MALASAGAFLLQARTRGRRGCRYRLSTAAASPFNPS